MGKARRDRRFIIVGLGCVALIAAAPFAPTHSSNQNTYLVRAIAAHAGGDLAQDHLVRSADPVRFFTWLARADLAVAGPLGFWFLWAAAVAVFFIALWWAATPREQAPLLTVCWFAGIGLLTAPVAQSVAERVSGYTNVDLRPSDLLSGVAGQYALGSVFQPSVGAVLMVLGVAAAVRSRRMFLAIVLLWCGALIHPTYLLSCWLLVPALVVAEVGSLWRSRLRDVGKWLVTSLAASLVVVLANWPAFAAVTDDRAATGNRILAQERIPHHADPGTWFGFVTVILILVVVVGAAVGTRSKHEALRRLGLVLAVGSLLAGCVSLVVAVVNVPSLQLAFPWRVSVVLIPLATAVVVSRLSELIDWRTTNRSWRRAVGAIALGALVVAAGSGMQQKRSAIAHRPGSDPLIVAIRDAETSGEGLVPPDLGDIRANAGVPIYVDWKNNPNEPSAVVEWWDRLAKAREAMDNPTSLCMFVNAHGFRWVVYPAQLRESELRCFNGWHRTQVGEHVLVWSPPGRS